MGITLEITNTSKISPKTWETFDTNHKYFRTINEANAFLAKTYGKAKKEKIYVDTKGGKTKVVGYIYHLGWQRDWSHNDPTKWLQQDWVSFIKTSNVDLEKKKRVKV